uniref:Uncharacterized protein n=1 Tax=Micrurus spixii TaxID=129469 RepID=A0A2D4M2E1_9SAUR
MPPRRQLVPEPAAPLWGLPANLVFGRLSPDHGERAALPPPLREFGTLGCLQPPFRFSSAVTSDSPGRNVAPVLHCGNGRPGAHGLSHRTRKQGDFPHAQQDLRLNQNGQN